MNEKNIAEKYAKTKGFHLNPNEKELDLILKGLENNRKKHGFPYCPCRIITGNKEKDREIICPCVYHRGEIEINGNCLCKLFWK
ncbi:MAG: ferredoxin-thioredoxin reductase catalytic domain-containing protein [Candidatus Nanoarchaeia archaeon]|nr:ferredoxin-thioredoxin reductase catalytic domain-containing protein [Candidatus Nanoarchaeia archaeon]